MHWFLHQAASIDDDDDEMSGSTKSSISTVVSGLMEKEKEGRLKAATLLPSGGPLKVCSVLRLFYIVAYVFTYCILWMSYSCVLYTWGLEEFAL